MASESERPTDSSNLDDEEYDRKRLFERAIPEVIKRVVERAVEAGVEKLSEAPENFRDLIADLRLPKEAAQYLYEQVDDTKKGVYRVVAKEIRDVLQHVNFADEITDVLTKVEFQINTTIRFVPGAAKAADDETGPEADASQAASPQKKKKRASMIPRPQVVSKVVMRARDALKPKDES